MRNKNVFAILGIVLITVGWLASNYIEKERQKAIVHEVWPLLSDCSSGQDSTITFAGKALVWEGKTDERSAAYDELPSNLKANSRSDNITIFVITNKQPKIIGTYQVTGEKAVQVRAFICVVSWPEKRVIGRTSIMGEPPPEEKDVTSGAKTGVGDINAPIANWITSLSENK